MSLDKSSRPLYHFTPSSAWMNDPNGLVYYQGEYHLFYQHNPESNSWGPMHWGHAVSRNLINWEHLPIALYPDPMGTIFSGSAVIDWQNTAGFGKEAMIAIFTHHQEGKQTQSLAYSLDLGRSWKKYAENPVLEFPGNSRDFRDPKVFWFQGNADSHWVMCLAAGEKVLFYKSPDLIHWTPSGQFCLDSNGRYGVWETPDLFELPVDHDGESRWVLTIGVQLGCPAGGSGTMYFIGDFDGCSFNPTYSTEEMLWVDQGADFYASQSWNDEPNHRRIFLGWMSNWEYANTTPSIDWRGMFSLPRELSLSKTEDGIRLVQKPISEIATLRVESVSWKNVTIVEDNNLLQDLRGSTFEIKSNFQIRIGTEHFGFRVRVGNGEETIIAYNAREQKLYLDRTHSGQKDFHTGFAGIHCADLSPVNGSIYLHIFVDSYSVEIFANHGQVTLTDSIFPSQDSLGLELFSTCGATHLNKLDFYPFNKLT